MASPLAKVHDWIPPRTPEAAEALPNSLHWFQRLLPHREDLIVAGREIKGGIVVHPILATAILGAVISIGGLMYHNFSTELTWQHDQLVILSTQKADAEKMAKQEHDDRALQESADRAWREKMSNQMAELRLQTQRSQ